MPTKSKFPGYDLVGIDEPFFVGDYYCPSSYDFLPGGSDFRIGGWNEVTERTGPLEQNQTFRQRHRVSDFTVIRKASKRDGLPVRLALSKNFSTPLPLP